MTLPELHAGPIEDPAARILDAEVRVVPPRHGLPYDPSVGAHELAWTYLLDLVFAHAFSSGLAGLRVELPCAGLEGPTGDRARAWGRGPDATGQGVALLGANQAFPAHASFVYRLRYGRMAPARLRRIATVPPGWRAERRFSVYRSTARLWGGPIRIAYLVGRPDLADRSMARLRRSFYAEGDSPAYYHLTVWRAP